MSSPCRWPQRAAGRAIGMPRGRFRFIERFHTDSIVPTAVPEASHSQPYLGDTKIISVAGLPIAVKTGRPDESTEFALHGLRETDRRKIL